MFYQPLYTSFNGGIYHEDRGCCRRRQRLGVYEWSVSDLVAAHPYIWPCSSCASSRAVKRVNHVRDLFKAVSPNYRRYFG